MWYFRINLMFAIRKLWREKRLESGNLEKRDPHLLNLVSLPPQAPTSKVPGAEELPTVQVCQVESRTELI